MWRRWRFGIVGVVLAVLAVALLAKPSDAGPTLLISYTKGSVNVPMGPGKSVKTSCTGDVAHISTCDGANCTELTTYPCLPFTCAKSGLECTATCVSSAECGQGAVCNHVRGECVSTTATCADTFTIKTANGQLVPCAPYKCVAGNCQQQCVTTSDCSAGFTCKRAASGRYYCAQGT
jgi:hypothetical protein